MLVTIVYHEHDDDQRHENRNDPERYAITSGLESMDLAPVRESVSLLSGMAAKEIVVSTMNMLYTVDGQLIISNVLTPAIALAFMAFTLIYFPCVATIGAIKTETGSWKWALFTVCYTLVLAWIVAFIVSKSFAFL